MNTILVNALQTVTLQARRTDQLNDIQNATIRLHVTETYCDKIQRLLFRELSEQNMWLVHARQSLG
jgi:hypothetical protein